MPGLFRPKSFPIRKITDGMQRLGRIFQQKRYPDLGGFDGQAQWGAHNEFTVTKPTSMRTAEKSNGRSDD